MSKNPEWCRAVLTVAGIYYIAWSLLAIIFPSIYLQLLDSTMQSDTVIWRNNAVMTGILGLGLLVSSANLFRYWPIVLMALVMEVLLPLNLYAGLQQGLIDQRMFETHLVFHMIWWLPFFLVLARVYREPYLIDRQMIDIAAEDSDSALEVHFTSKSRNLLEASREQPVMLVFLRHFGCTFCREALSDLGRKRAIIESSGTKLILVHMISEQTAGKELSKYGLADLEHCSDPESMLYKSFRLQRGRWWQLFGPRVITRGIYAGLVRKLGIGAPMGDVYQMPGIFLIYEGRIVKKFYHRTAADIPPYLELADCSACLNA